MHHQIFIRPHSIKLRWRSTSDSNTNHPELIWGASEINYYSHLSSWPIINWGWCDTALENSRIFIREKTPPPRASRNSTTFKRPTIDFADLLPTASSCAEYCEWCSQSLPHIPPPDMSKVLVALRAVECAILAHLELQPPPLKMSRFPFTANLFKVEEPQQQQRPQPLLLNFKWLLPSFIGSGVISGNLGNGEEELDTRSRECFPGSSPG